jgi:uracil-DNA glycosylase
MNIKENKEDLRRELLTMVQSLKSRIQHDIDLGRSTSYLQLRGKVKSEEQPSTHVETSNFLPLKQISAAGSRDYQDNDRLQQRDILTLDKVRADLGNCQRCALGRVRTNLVFGEGNPEADLVFVGEAPGADEDVQGRPFVGRAGQLLTRIISAMGLSRQDVYICNILKCRPPGNRNPKQDEIHACEPFLIRQLKAINPKAICALGTFAAQTLLKTDTPITILRGRFHSYQGIKLMPTYHPAYLLRNPGSKKQVWDDIQMVMKILPDKNKEA